MKRRKRPYAEGSWFAVPLLSSGTALGVIARVGLRGVVLGYFFGPRRDAPPEINDVSELRSGGAMLVGRFGDHGMVGGKWSVLGPGPDWDRSGWPVPAFGRVDADAGRAWLVTYTDALEMIDERNCLIAEAQQLPVDGVWGPGAIERRLSTLLGNPTPPGDDPDHRAKESA